MRKAVKNQVVKEKKTGLLRERREKKTERSSKQAE
jgi:hypothetical protein